MYPQMDIDDNLITVFEVARLTLRSRMIHQIIAEELDLSDEAMAELQFYTETVLEKEERRER